MKPFKHHSLESYLTELSLKKPVPGGGSAAAMVAALACGLLSMVVHYSLGRGKYPEDEKIFKSTLKKTERLRKRFLELVDLDSQSYLSVVAARKLPENIKKAKMKKALIRAQRVPQEVCRLCYEALLLTPYLIERGNSYLRSDVEVAVEFLQAAFNSAKINVQVNQ